MSELPETGYYNAREWAKSFEITEGQFKEWVKQHEIPHFKIGHSMVVRAQDFWPRVPFVMHGKESTVGSCDRTDALAKEPKDSADDFHWIPPDGSGEFNVKAWAGFVRRGESTIRQYLRDNPIGVRVIGDQRFISPEAFREAFPLVKSNTIDRPGRGGNRRKKKGDDA